MALDKTGFKILWALDYNARAPLSQLAKNAGISKQNLNYRLKELLKQGVLRGFISVVDIHHLGYLTYRVYFRYKNVNQKKEQQIIDYFKAHSHSLWVVSVAGSWDLEVVFVARNFIHFNNIFKKIKEDLGRHFSKYNISMSVVNYHFKRDYLLGKKRDEFAPLYYGFEPKSEALDKLDFGILLELSKNCRQGSQEIAQKIGVTYHTIKQRIRKLEEKNIIQSHRILLDLEKINRKFLKAAIVLNNPSKAEEEKLYAYCSQHNFVVYLVEVVGEWQFEIEVEVEKEEQLTELLRNIRNKFPELILDYNILLVTKEHKTNYFPMGEELLKNAVSGN